ncbi:MAG TPA: hypothetical protein VGE41_12645, partial [Verrucomicrobiae bacterium]
MMPFSHWMRTGSPVCHERAEIRPLLIVEKVSGTSRCRIQVIATVIVRCYFLCVLVIFTICFGFLALADFSTSRQPMTNAVPAVQSTNSISNAIPPRLPPEAVELFSRILPTNDPVEKEYRQLLEEDDTSQAEADKWIKQEDEYKAKGAPDSVNLKARVLQRFEPVKKHYEDFLRRNPNHARAHLAYGSFLGDIGEEDASAKELEKAKELDPSNPAA